MHRLITTTDALNTLCEKLAQAEYVTVDTEFIREKTYYPRLCLVQLAGPNDEAAVDPLAQGIDLSALFDLLANPKIIKVFHAAKQDVEIFLQLAGKIPSPLYDTQVAAMVCGYGEQIGYEALVNTILNEQLDKASRYTDWAQRPLTQRQIDYAISDVTHLRHVYESLRDEIAAKGRESWISEEMANLCETTTYVIQPDEAWRRMKYKNRSPAYLNALQAVASWRERLAQIKDVPRGRLLKDEVVLQIAAMNPKTVEDLAQVRGAMHHLSADNARAIITAMEEARSKPREEFPRDEKKRTMLTPAQEGLVDVLKLLLKMQCDEAKVASKLVADKEEIASFILNPSAPSPFAQGWRHDVFGKDARAFLDGKLVLCNDKRHNAITFEER